MFSVFPHHVPRSSRRTEKCLLCGGRCSTYNAQVPAAQTETDLGLNNHENQSHVCHAGCPVCVAAEQSVASALDPSKYEVEIVHLGKDKSRLKEAESAGVRSVPAPVMDGGAFHINFGAGIEALK